MEPADKKVIIIIIIVIVIVIVGGGGGGGGSGRITGGITLIFTPQSAHLTQAFRVYFSRFTKPRSR